MVFAKGAVEERPLSRVFSVESRCREVQSGFRRFLWGFTIHLEPRQKETPVLGSWNILEVLADPVRSVRFGTAQTLDVVALSRFGVGSGDGTRFCTVSAVLDEKRRFVLHGLGSNELRRFCS